MEFVICWEGRTMAASALVESRIAANSNPTFITSQSTFKILLQGLACADHLLPMQGVPGFNPWSGTSSTQLRQKSRSQTCNVQPKNIFLSVVECQSEEVDLQGRVFVVWETRELCGANNPVLEAGKRAGVRTWRAWAEQGRRNWSEIPSVKAKGNFPLVGRRQRQENRRWPSTRKAAADSKPWRPGVKCESEESEVRDEMALKKWLFRFQRTQSLVWSDWNPCHNKFTCNSKTNNLNTSYDCWQVLGTKKVTTLWVREVPDVKVRKTVVCREGELKALNNSEIIPDVRQLRRGFHKERGNELAWMPPFIRHWANSMIHFI